MISFPAHPKMQKVEFGRTLPSNEARGSFTASIKSSSDREAEKARPHVRIKISAIVHVRGFLETEKIRCVCEILVYTTYPNMYEITSHVGEKTTRPLSEYFLVKQNFAHALISSRL